MKVGIPKEIASGETRVALVPKMVGLLKKAGAEVLVERDAGEASSFSNTEYEEAGATIVSDAPSLYSEADVIVKVQPPQNNEDAGKHEVEMIKPGSTFIGFLAPMENRDVIQQMVDKKITSFSMEFVPPGISHTIMFAGILPSLTPRPAQNLSLPSVMTRTKNKITDLPPV